MNEASVYVFRVDTPGGPRDYVSLVSPEVAFPQGLAPEAIVGGLLRPLGPGESITPEVFVQNPAFVEFLHGVIARHGPNQPGLKSEATRVGTGYVLVLDERTATPQGSVPPEDVLGAFAVEGGRILPASYRPSPNHAILSQRGFFRLSAGLQECLLRELAAPRRVG